MILLVMVIASAIVVITVRHENRLAFVRLQKAEGQRAELQTEWGQLMLERATWSIEHNIADVATKQLGMAPPSADKIVTVHLEKSN